MGRPKLDIDDRTIRRMAEYNLPVTTMAALLGCDESTIRKRFSVELLSGRAWRELRLRVKQYQQALAGDATMLIWLGKNELGQSNTTVHRHESSEERKLTLRVENLSVGEMRQYMHLLDKMRLPAPGDQPEQAAAQQDASSETIDAEIVTHEQGETQPEDRGTGAAESAVAQDGDGPAAAPGVPAGDCPEAGELGEDSGDPFAGDVRRWR